MTWICHAPPCGNVDALSTKSGYVFLTAGETFGFGDFVSIPRNSLL